MSGARAAAFLLALLLLPSAAAETVTLIDGDASVAVSYDPVFRTGEAWFIDLVVENGDGYMVEAAFSGAAPRSKALNTCHVRPSQNDGCNPSSFCAVSRLHCMPHRDQPQWVQARNSVRRSSPSRRKNG